MKYWTPDHSRDSMDSGGDDSGPETAPSGDLSEPPRRPPTALATSAPGPEPRPPRPHRLRRSARMSRVEEVVNAALDVLDGIADAVRTAAARALR